MADVEAVGPATGSSGRRDIAFISLLRAAASLIVVWCHLVYAWNVSHQTSFAPLTVVTQYVTQPLAIIQHGGFLGVAIFFFVSGFIITHVAQREGQLTFLVKRLLRIFPPLIFSVVVIGLLAVAKARLTGESAEFDGYGAADYVRAMTLWNYMRVPQNVVNVVAWTLVVEVAFYLLCLLMLPLMRAAPLASTWLLAAVCWAGVLRGHDFGPRFGAPSVCFGLVPLLLVGQATYWAWSGRAKFWQFALTAAACYFVFVCALGNVFASFFPAGNSYGVSAAYAYLVFVAALGLNDRLRLPRWVEFYSTISYSLYLLHLPVGFFVLALLVPRIGYAWAIVPAFAVVTLASYVSWRLVEEPSQRLARRVLKWAPGRAEVTAEAPRVNRAYAAVVAAVFVVAAASLVFLGPTHTRSVGSMLLPATLAAATAPPPPAPAAATAVAPVAPAPPAAPAALVAVEGAGQPSPLSPEPVPQHDVVSATVGGSLELVDRDVISGWAWNRAEPSTRVAVAVYVDGVYAGWGRADRHREDLAKAGIGDGRHAYLVQAPAILKGGDSHTVAVKVVGFDVDLWGSPKSFP